MSSTYVILNKRSVNTVTEFSKPQFREMQLKARHGDPDKVLRL